MRRARPQEEEEIRLQNSKELMYGNMDKDKVYPFDVSAKYKYLVFHEVIGFTEDEQSYSKKSTQRYSHFSVSQWENMKQTDYFKRRKITVTVLHDPIKQAAQDGIELDGVRGRGLTLAQKLANIDKEVPKVDTIEDTKVPKRPAARKEVVDNG